MQNQNPTNPDNSGPKPKKSTYVSVDEFIIKANTAYTNAKLPDIAPLLTKKSYTPAKIDAALVNIGTLKTLNSSQQTSKAAKEHATEQLNALRDALAAKFADHITTARNAFGEDLEKSKKLGIDGERSRSLAGFVRETRQFYNTALEDEDIKAALEARDVSATDLQDGLDCSNQLEILKADQTKKSGISQGATSTRDTLYAECKKWFSEFKPMAILATKAHPQMREQLGFKE